MKRGLPIGLASFAFGAAFGFVTGGWDHETKLADCAARSHACDLTAEGSVRLIDATYQQLQTCELALDAADATINRINAACASLESDLRICEGGAK